MFSTVSNTLVPRLNRTLSCIFYLVKFIRPDEVGQCCCIISVSLRKSFGEWVHVREKRKKNAQISLDVGDKWKKISLVKRQRQCLLWVVELLIVWFSGKRKLWWRKCVCITEQEPVLFVGSGLWRSSGCQYSGSRPCLCMTTNTVPNVPPPC